MVQYTLQNHNDTYTPLKDIKTSKSGHDLEQYFMWLEKLSATVTCSAVNCDVCTDTSADTCNNTCNYTNVSGNSTSSDATAASDGTTTNATTTSTNSTTSVISTTLDEHEHSPPKFSGQYTDTSSSNSSNSNSTVNSHSDSRNDRNNNSDLTGHNVIVEPKYNWQILRAKVAELTKNLRSDWCVINAHCSSVV